LLILIEIHTLIDTDRDMSAPEVPAGHVGNLTAEQTEALTKFKENLQSQNLFKPAEHDDHLLLRFLRARKFDIVKTMEMFSNCEKWRTEFKVDEVYQSFTFEEGPQVNALYPRYYHKTDKLGRPIYIEVLSNVNLEQLFKLTTRERLEKNFIYEYEKLARVRLPACGKEAGHHIETGFTILDLKNCSVMQALKIKDVLQFIVQTGQNYYPETMGMTFIINVPWIFDTVWGFVKMWMDEVTVNKIKIFKNGKDYTATLFEYIDPANLPFALGGACKCEGGCENSDCGPWNPPK
jgi:hypothetical protein